MSESMIVEVRRLREAQSRIEERLVAMLEMVGARAVGDDLDALLDELEAEIARLMQSTDH